MNNIKLSLDPIMYRKIEKLAIENGVSFRKFLTSFFANWVSTPKKNSHTITSRRASFCRKGVDTRKSRKGAPYEH